MTTHRPTHVLCSLFLGLLTSTAWAQDSLANSGLQWGVSAGWNHYKEPHLMQLSGPELGLHGQIQTDNQLQYEGEVLWGSQHYDSTSTGSMDHVSNVHSYWRVLTPVWGTHANGISAGLAYHTLWNDLRGQTSTLNNGYQRIANQLWAPLRWRVNAQWQLDAGVLIYGRHQSNLSEAGRSDLINTQRRGQYLQVSGHWPTQDGDTFTPFVRYTHLGDSNHLPGGYEPASQRWQAGLSWTTGRL